MHPSGYMDATSFLSHILTVIMQRFDCVLI